MAVTLKHVKMKIKDATSGEYDSVDILSDGTTAERVAAINSAATTQIENVNSAGTTQVGNVNTAGATQIAAVQAKGVETIESIPDDYTELSEEVTELKSAIDSMETATAEDEGKALKAKTVSGGKVTEWEFGETGGILYTVENSNLLAGISWSGNQSDPIPVEYGKSYTANFTAYKYRVYALDANGNSLGNLDNYNGVTYAESFSAYDWKALYTVTNTDVVFIQFRQMNKPSKTPLYILEGDVPLPYPYVEESVEPVQPDANNARNAMLGALPVGLQDLTEDLQDTVNQLGWNELPVNSGVIKDYDAETCPCSFDNGTIRVGNPEAFSADNGTHFLFKKNVNRVKYNFARRLITNNNYRIPYYFILETNNGHSGTLLAFNASGYAEIGVSYIYEWRTNGTLVARTNAYTFAADHQLASMEVTKNTDSYDFVFIDTEGVVITRHWTFAELGIIDADYMGFKFAKRTSYIQSDLLVAYGAETSAVSTVGSTSSSSPMYGAIYDAWGDSYTAPVGSYAAIIAENTGCTVNNLGVSGDKVSSVLSRFNSRSDACGAYVSVLAGVNDYLHDTTMENFRTSVQSLITAVITKAPSSKFLWITPAQIGSQGEGSLGLTLEDYVNAIIEICEKNSVPVLDLYHNGSWYGNVQAFQQIYMSVDLLHPNNVGQTFLAGKIQKALEAL